MKTHATAMGARILIVEDEEPLTLLLRYNLEAEGYQVDIAARGDEAEIRLKESPPDLVVLDWMLPACSPAASCSTACGAATSTSTSVRSTCTSAGCAARSTAAARPIRSAPCVAAATRSMTGSIRDR